MIEEVMRPGAGHLIEFVGGPNAGQRSRLFGHSEGDILPVHLLNSEWTGPEHPEEHWVTHLYRVQGDRAIYLGLSPDNAPEE